MVKVIFEYNPYIMDYKIKFNGLEPRVNSMIEKYLKLPLQMWVNDVPDIFRKEMNGYDFEVEFIGTSMDFNEIIKAFRNKGVKEKDVKFTLKKELNGRVDKLDLISKLIEWLQENRNRKFDLDTFKIEKPDIFDDIYPMVVISNEVMGGFEFDNAKISIELIENIEELNNTNLDDTPVIIDCENDIFSEVINNIKRIVSRNDIRQEQLFFLLNKNEKEIHRLLEDYGIDSPQLIENMDDDKIKRYFEYYPVSNYIRMVISNMRKIVDSINEVVKKEIEESKKINGEILKKISDKERVIESLKEGLGEIEDKQKEKYVDEVDDFSQWGIIRAEVVDKIKNWKIKKTKIISYAEGHKAAEQFNEEIQHIYEIFYNKLESIYTNAKEVMLEEIQTIFDEAVSEKNDFSIKDINGVVRVKDKIDDLTLELLKLKEEMFVKKKDSFFGGLFVVPDAQKEEVLVMKYDCQQWREYVYGIVIPIVDKNIKDRVEDLDNMKQSVTEKYHNKLQEILDDEISKKDELPGQLSEDNQLLQKDSDWLVEFEDKVKEIERK